jgi:hypothetical protein
MSTPAPVWGEDEIDEEIMSMTTDEIRMRTKHIEEETRFASVHWCFSVGLFSNSWSSPRSKVKEKCCPPLAPLNLNGCSRLAYNRMYNSEIKRLQHETDGQKEAIKENKEKIKLNKQLPYLVSCIRPLIVLQHRRPLISYSLALLSLRKYVPLAR